MSTLRYSGEIRIRVTYLEAHRGGGNNGAYRCYLRGPGGMATTVIVGAPAYLSHAVDSPEAFDEAAHASIGFADDSDEEKEERLSCYHWANIAAHKADGSGWHVGRSEKQAWPDEPSPRGCASCGDQGCGACNK